MTLGPVRVMGAGVVVMICVEEVYIELCIMTVQYDKVMCSDWCFAVCSLIIYPKTNQI